MCSVAIWRRAICLGCPTSKFLYESKVKSEVESKVKSEVESKVESEVKSNVESEVESEAESRVWGGSAGRVRPGENFSEEKILRGEAPQDFFRDHRSKGCDGRTGATVENVFRKK